MDVEGLGMWQRAGGWIDPSPSRLHHNGLAGQSSQRHDADVTTIAELLTIADPADRAAAANDLLWQRPELSGRLREARGQAIREAMSQGRSPETLAEHLKVQAADLAWMIG